MESRSTLLSRIVGASLITAGLLALIVPLPFGLAAFLAMFDQCPDGNDCSDAKTVTTIAAILEVIGLAVAGLGFAVLKSKRSQ